MKYSFLRDDIMKLKNTHSGNDITMQDGDSQHIIDCTPVYNKNYGARYVV